MPRAMRVPLSNSLVTIKKGEAAPATGRRRQEAPAVERVALTFRITTASYERLRRMAFETRVSQQSLVDQALDRLFAERGS
jgi:Ribbon-helix-helix domain